jgi:hypothetical protein
MFLNKPRAFLTLPSHQLNNSIQDGSFYLKSVYLSC